MIQHKRERQIAIGPGSVESVLTLLEAMHSRLADGFITARGSGDGFDFDATGDDATDDLQALPWINLDHLAFTAIDSNGTDCRSLGVELRRTERGFTAHCRAYALRVATVEAELAGLTQLVNEFGGEPTPPIQSTDLPDTKASRRVERSHKPERWEAWAATRTQYAELADDILGILQSAGAQEPNVSLSTPGFDDSFQSSTEFLSHVDEKLWRENKHASLRARCSDGELDGLTVALSVGKYSVDLNLSGASRAGRNSVLPDIKARTDRHARGSDAFPWLRSLRAATYASFVALAAGLIVLIALLSGGLGVLIAFPAILFCSIPALWLSFHIDDKLDDARPAIEFLPDSGQSRWSDLVAKLMTAGRRTGALITIVGVVVGILAAFGVL